MEQQFDEQVSLLAEQGLNWLAFVPQELGPLPEGCSNGPGRGLLLLLSLGPRYGSQTSFEDPALAHPFDARATQLTQSLVSSCLAEHDPDSRLVYPGPRRVDLRAWLAAGEVQYTSELGIGIRPDCGTWLAVRAAVWVALPGALRSLLTARYPKLSGPSPCETCTDKPCLSACPADAFQSEDRLGRCVENRLRAQTTCAGQCWSRSACPVGVAHRYPPHQMSYHYGVSLRVIQRWQRAQEES